MPTEKEIEAAAKALCFANGQVECMGNHKYPVPCTAESCPFGLRDFREEAIAALEAAERARESKCLECGTVATPAVISFHTKECQRGRIKPTVIDDD